MPTLVEPNALPLPLEARTNGCFETMRAYRGRIFRLEAHLDRLHASAQFLATPMSVERQALRRRLTQALSRSGLRDAVVRVALVPQSSHTVQPSIVVVPVPKPTASAFQRGIRLAVVPTRKFPVSVIDQQAKYSARLGSVLAILEAQLRGADEAVFMDAAGWVTESTASNLGIISRRTLFTPPCWTGLLAGITREVVLDVAHAIALPVREVPLTRHDLYNADEAFLLSTIKEVLPVTRIDGRRIGTGRPGPVTKRLHRAFREVVRREMQHPS